MKLSTLYHASAVPHPEISSGYWGRFMVAGKPPQWVIDPSGARRIFATKEAAELAAYKAMTHSLNTVSISLAKTRTTQRTASATSREKTEAEKVFANFKGVDKNKS